MFELVVKRIYEPWDASDGYRLLCDRLWPRGVSKAEAGLDAWAKELAPSAGLRRALHHNELSWDAFAAQYENELSANAALAAWTDTLRTILADQTVFLLTAAQLETRCHVHILRDVLAGLLERRK